jgi:DNA-binding NarL/FixJ family response regulator
MKRDLTTGKSSLTEGVDLKMSPHERQQSSFLIVEEEPETRNQFRSVLRTIGFGSMHIAGDHISALKVLDDRHFTHTIFSAASTNMPPEEYLRKILSTSARIVAIPSSSNPNVDDVFELLRLGARGFLIKPFTTDSLEIGILMATKGEPMSDAILQAKDRNEAFSALIAANIDKLASAMRYSNKSSSLSNHLDKLSIDLKSCVELGRMFAKGGEKVLQERMIDFFIELSNGPATRLGRVRHRLKHKRLSSKAKKNEKDSKQETSVLPTRSGRSVK